jgi:hypothetical protein
MHGAANADIDIRRCPHTYFPAFAQIYEIVGDLTEKDAMRDLTGEDVQPVAGVIF